MSMRNRWVTDRLMALRVALLCLFSLKQPFVQLQSTHNEFSIIQRTSEMVGAAVSLQFKEQRLETSAQQAIKS